MIINEQQIMYLINIANCCAEFYLMQKDFSAYNDIKTTLNDITNQQTFELRLIK